jgi:predicted GIY-YIG superfamily endonuclease
MTMKTEDLETSGAVYCIKNIKNGMLYVGATDYLTKRWAQHKAAQEITLERIKLEEPMAVSFTVTAKGNYIVDHR